MDKQMHSPSPAFKALTTLSPPHFWFIAFCPPPPMCAPPSPTLCLWPRSSPSGMPFSSSQLLPTPRSNVFPTKSLSAQFQR